MRLARVSDEEAGSTDAADTSRGVFVATLPQFGAVIGENVGVVCSTPGDEGRIVQAWVNIVGGLRVSAVFFWRSDVWTSRTKALIESAMTACENHESFVIDGT